MRAAHLHVRVLVPSRAEADQVGSHPVLGVPILQQEDPLCLPRCNHASEVAAGLRLISRTHGTLPVPSAENEISKPSAISRASPL